MMWKDFFYQGGFGMYPTMLFGFLLVMAGVLLIIRPERRFLPLVYSLGFLTLGSGLLGTTVGIVNTFHYLQRVPQVEQFKIAALGCAESLNNMVLALILLVLTALLVSIGAARFMRKPQTAEA